MIVDCAVYRQGRREQEAVPLEETFERSRAPDSFAWIGLHEPTPEEFDAVAREFALHELAVEDAIKAHQRPKLEVYGDSLFLVLKTVQYEYLRVRFGEILLFVGDGFLISVRHGDFPLHDVRLELERRPDLLARGPAAALYAIADRVVDTYLPVAGEVDGDIRGVEIDVFSPTARIPRRASIG